ncbi:ssDNA-binding domain-containing protein [Eubacteriales bacterium OttesenSCG-928-G02]|nr:ssDNA-binding domain-containing protein [Eubacteriales bacterium OttesenSCG-928-G02]
MKRADAYDLIDHTAKEISADGGKFQQYLDVQTKFDRYSAGNALLITAQMPNATQFKDFDGWKENGASIKKQQKGITILEPGEEYTREDGSVGVSYNVKKVFDVSQTTSTAKSQPTVNRDERILLSALINKRTVPIQSVDDIPNNMGAYYDHENKVILVRKGMDAPDIFRSVAQELAHADFASKNENYTRSSAGFNAYCVSYMLCKKNGFDVKNYDFSELPDNIRQADAQSVRAQLSDVRETMSDISSKMSKALENTKPSKEQER